MKKKPNTPLPELSRVFHEPKRLAILIELYQSEKGATFTELKTACQLTDGNLNRHLKMLEEHDIIRSRRSVEAKHPRTLVQINAQGKRKFIRYLGALDTVLKRAMKATRG